MDEMMEAATTRSSWNVANKRGVTSKTDRLKQTSRNKG